MQSQRPSASRRLFLITARLAPSVLLLGLAGFLIGCAASVTPDGRDASVERDAGVERDASVEHDAGTDLGARCELPYDQRAIDQVSTGVITIASPPADSTTFIAQIDATAGGSTSYGEKPFVYLDLIGGKKVDITDVQAEQSGDWDIAFKRWQIKLNGGSSGPGMVGAAIIVDKTLAEVTQAPPEPYATDSYFDAQCKLQLDAIGGLQTVLADWYDYDTGNNGLVPKKEVIVLNRRDHKGHIKVQLGSYYKGTVSANYELSWSLLP